MVVYLNVLGDKSGSDDSQFEGVTDDKPVETSEQNLVPKSLKSIMQKPSNSKTTPANNDRQVNISEFPFFSISKPGFQQSYMVTPPNPPSRPVARNNPPQFLQRRERLKASADEEQMNQKFLVQNEKRPKSLRDQRLAKINIFDGQYDKTDYCSVIASEKWFLESCDFGNQLTIEVLSQITTMNPNLKRQRLILLWNQFLTSIRTSTAT